MSVHNLRKNAGRAALAGLAALFCGCVTAPPADPVTALLEPGERIELRMPAELQHGHDMEIPAYDERLGYPTIESHPGELVLSDRRLLFVVRGDAAAPAWVSIPFAAIARARPSRTPLLNYVVVWDAASHADSFLVGPRHVQALHQALGRALMARGRPAVTAPGHDAALAPPPR